MNEVPLDCICRRLLDLGIVEAVENAIHRDEMFIAMQECLDKGLCCQDKPEPSGHTSPSLASIPPDGGASRRKRTDRRSGSDRRELETALPLDRERRVSVERRSGGDRRGLLAGEKYTIQQAVLNLQAWCNGHCRGTFDLRLDAKTGELQFQFEDSDDRADFTKMLRKFKEISAS